MRGGATITWQEFLQNRNKYKSDKIVIGSVVFYDEIKKIIVESKCFEEKNILYIDEWVKSFLSVDDCLQRKTQSIQPVEIRNEKLANARLLANRTEALKEMPLNMITAEVGVAYGDFTEKILEIMKPAKFYAIDIFQNVRKGIWGDDDVFGEAQKTHLAYYKDRFKAYIEKDIMKIRKGISWEQMDMFPDDYFDWVYLDAAHDYYSVKKDVEVLIKKVKHGGFIQFNDYIFYDHMTKVYYGVIQVVNKLLEDTKCSVEYYCLGEKGFDDIVVRVVK